MEQGQEREGARSENDSRSLEERIQYLEDVRAAEAVLVAYARCVDEQDAAGLAALFTEEGQLCVPGAEPVTGRARIVKLYGRLLGALSASTHVVSNFETELTAPDRACVRCVLWAWEGFGSSLSFVGPENRLSFGRYVGQLVRQGGGQWQMASLTISFAGQTAKS